MNLPGTFLIGQLWWYAATVLRPAQRLKPLGLVPRNEIGSLPTRQPRAGGGPLFSKRHHQPVYMKQPPPGYDAVEAFDELSGGYEHYVEFFSRPIFEETVELMELYLGPDARILDCGCGPGTEALELAGRVPQGEVVAMDLAADMVAKAADSAQARGLANMAFFQSDVAQMPAAFAGRFDAIYCSLAFHHYPRPLESLQEMFRVLAPGGKVFIADAGPPWMKLVGSPLARWADPGWVAFRTGDEFQQLFQQAGFSQFYWTEVLPGIGLSIGSR
jgi:ubiquinone/menaquinone biosynthesis C-methylase UbiE